MTADFVDMEGPLQVALEEVAPTTKALREEVSDQAAQDVLCVALAMLHIDNEDQRAIAEYLTEHVWTLVEAGGLYSAPLGRKLQEALEPDLSDVLS
ncbi:MAG: hypothetical protein GY772_23325 [bacterium]|nr:hypothetical protein [bacterium]